MKYLFMIGCIFINSILGVSLVNVEEEKHPSSRLYKLQFDAPYTGKIHTKNEHNVTKLFLEEAAFESNKTFEKTTILGEETYVVLTFKDIPLPIVSAAKSADGLSLWIEANITTPKAEVFATPLETKPELELGWRYIVVVSLLSLLLAALIYIKKKNITIGKGGSSSSWLFKSEKEQIEGVKLLYQKNLDARHKVIYFEFGGNRYLILSGATSLLLDKSPALPIEVTEGDFASMLRSNQARLDFYLGEEDKRFNDFTANAERNGI